MVGATYIDTGETNRGGASTARAHHLHRDVLTCRYAYHRGCRPPRSAERHQQQHARRCPLPRARVPVPAGQHGNRTEDDDGPSGAGRSIVTSGIAHQVRHLSASTDPQPHDVEHAVGAGLITVPTPLPVSIDFDIAPLVTGSFLSTDHLVRPITPLAILSPVSSVPTPAQVAPTTTERLRRCGGAARRDDAKRPC